MFSSHQLRVGFTRGIAVAVAAGFAVLGGSNVQAVPTPVVVPAAQVLTGPALQAAQLTSFDQQMIGLINRARVTAGRVPLHEARGLTSLAVYWSSQLSSGTTNYNLAHNPNAWTMVTTYGASQRTSWGENVAWSSSSGSAPKDLFDAYMASPGHKANILSPAYRYIGMGSVATDEHGLWNSTEFTDQADAAQIVAQLVVAPAPPAPAATSGNSLTVRDSVGGSVLKPVIVMLRDATCARPIRLMYADGTGTVPMPALRTGTYCLQVRGVPAGYTLPVMKRIAVHPNVPFTTRIMATAAPVSGRLTVASASSHAAMAGVTFMLRDRGCIRPLRLLYSGAGGVTPVNSIAPGVYCVTTASVPAGMAKHAPFKFAAPLNGTFSVAVAIDHAI